MLSMIKHLSVREITLSFISITVPGFLIFSTSLSAAPSVPIASELCANTQSDKNCVTAQLESTPPTNNPVTPASGKLKWNPGHYMNATKDRSTFQKIYNQPHIKGVKMDYYWPDLEPVRGKYDFSQIVKDLAELQSHGKRLAIMVLVPKAFGPNARKGKCAPKYIHDMGGVDLRIGVKNGNNVCNVKMWLPKVQDRILALDRALGARFNKEPFLEAVITEESSLGYGQISRPADYNGSAYRAALKKRMLNLKKSFPNTLVYQSMNFVDGGKSAIADLMDYAYKIGIGVTGPDLAPNYQTWSTPLHRKYAGKMPLAIDNQDSFPLNNYIKNGGTVEGAFDYAVTAQNGLHADHIFWLQRENPSGKSFKHFWFSKEILPMINRKSAAAPKTQGFGKGKVQPEGKPRPKNVN